MTSMALLAFLGHCELQDSPQYGPTVQKAIDFLTSASPDEMTGTGNNGAHAHGIRTYALCECIHDDQNSQTQGIRKTHGYFYY